MEEGIIQSWVRNKQEGDRKKDLATSSFSVPNVRTTLANDKVSSATSLADATESCAALAVFF